LIKILKHLFLIISALILLIIFTFYIYFPFITNHGESITVPNLIGLNISEIDKILSERDLRYEVIPDSSFTTKFSPFTIIYQNPNKGLRVKEGRKIYLTLNSIQPPKIKMPELINGSVKNAQLILKTYDLLLGQINYVPDKAANAVIQQYNNGKIILAGSLVSKGSTIDLDIGNGLGNQIFETPNLIGLDLEEGKFTILGSGLSIGEINYVKEGVIYTNYIDENGNEKIREIDADIGIIFKQNPKFPRKIKIGRKIDLWVINDSILVNK